ncbi:DUF2284 domain-containing protein, partial [Chloroflexota bacterium]
MVRKIMGNVPEKILQKDLEKYRQKAIKVGATDAKIITTDMVLIDERVRAKCIYPKCDWYGTSANCPPHTMDLEQTRKVVNNYKYAIFFIIRVPAETEAGKRTPEQIKYSRRTSKTRLDILAKIESEAFYDGYYLAMGFGGGPCKPRFCPDIDCQALKPGQGCKFPFYSRASMEGVGMNVYAMVT